MSQLSMHFKLLISAEACIGVFVACASIQPIRDHYAKEANDVEFLAEFMKVSENASFITDEMADERYISSFAKERCGLNPAKQKTWSKNASMSCSQKYQAEFFKRVAEKYPYMDSDSIVAICSRKPKECTNRNIEEWARISHNEKVDRARASDVGRLEQERDIAIVEEEARASRAWAAVAAGFAAAAAAQENSRRAADYDAREPAAQYTGYGGYGSAQPAPQGNYLGNLSSNPYAPNSIGNRYGAGSPYGANSVTNPYGKYGSPYSGTSATNPYTTNAPKLYDKDGNYRGRLSANPYDPESTSNPYGRYGSPYSSDSINNQYGPGSPYRFDSPNNSYGTGLKVIGQ